MHTKQEKKLFRIEMRKKPTPAENKFKGYLCNSRIRHNFQKIRQFYIVDFWIKDYPYIIEVDGEYHQTQTQQAYDQRRDRWLEEQYQRKVVRIKNSEVYSKDFLENLYRNLFT